MNTKKTNFKNKDWYYNDEHLIREYHLKLNHGSIGFCIGIGCFIVFLVISSFIIG